MLTSILHKWIYEFYIAVYYPKKENWREVEEKMYRASNGIKHVVNHNAQHEVCIYTADADQSVVILKRASDGKIMGILKKNFLRKKINN